MDVNFSLLGAQAVAGLTRGMLYYLLASGLTLIFGVLGIINFAHGTFYMITVFLTITIAVHTNYWMAAIFAPVILAFVGGICEVFLLRRIYKAHHLLQLLLTFALVYIGVDVVKIFWGTYPKSLPQVDLLQGGIFIGGIRLPFSYLYMISVSAATGIALWLILYKTKWGTIIRACTIDSEVADALGINVRMLFTLVFMLGIYLAGIGGVVAAPVIGAVSGMDMEIIILCFAVVIVGGVGSLKGALLGALIIGLVESFGLLVLPQFAIAFIFGVMTIALILRPRGLLGRSAG
jgi:branched-chain amino acid transport system permease protein